MVGRAHKSTWALLGLGAASICMLAAAPESGAGGPHALARLRADDGQLAAKSRAAVLGLYSLDARLAGAQARLGSLEAEARRLEAQQASIGAQLRLAQLDERLSQNRLASRVRYLYLHGSTSPLEVVLGASSLDDVMTQLDDFRRVTTANQNVVVQVRSAQGRLARLAHALSFRKRALTETTREAAATADALARTRLARGAYLAQLTRMRAFDAAQIAELTAQARAAEARSQQLTHAASNTRTTTDAPPRAPSPVAPLTAGRTLTVIATGYDLSGATSTGLPVGWGVAAVDPAVIPLGSRLTIPGYGDAIAADTGPSVRGSTIDLWFPTIAQAYAWGRRSVTIALN